MLRWSLNSYLSINELKNFINSKQIFKNTTEKRKAVKICVIDDEPFSPKRNLFSYGYEIEEISDIKSIEEVSGYDIILCDLMGVGQSFDPAQGGASIIKEIKKNLPSKFIIAYSGARSNTIVAVAAREYADDFIKKDAELNEWTDLLDKFVEQSVDPWAMWRIARTNLLALDVDIKNVVRLEDAFVRSVNAKDTKFLALNEELAKIPANGNVKGVVQSLVASAIYSLIFGA